MYLSSKQWKITYSPGRFRNDYTQMQEVEYKTNQKNPSHPTGQETSSGEAFDFWKLRKGPLTNTRKFSKRRGGNQRTVKVAV